MLRASLPSTRAGRVGHTRRPGRGPARMSPPSASGAVPNGAPASPESLPTSVAPRKYALATLLVHSGALEEDPLGASSPPIYQTATFRQPGATTGGAYDYTRSGNPTRNAVETQWAALEGAERAFLFTSGMAALATVTHLLSHGDHIVAGDDLYGGTSRLLARVCPAAGLEVTNVDTCDVEAVIAALRPGRTKLLMLESPTNPRLQICDIAALSRAAHDAGALVCVDNSILTPLYQRPLDLGADISMTSATKYPAGHSDLMAGALAVRDAGLAARLAFLQNAEGTGLAPHDAWLLGRGLKTMALRMERQASNAARLAAWLAARPEVHGLAYPGLRASVGHSVHVAQATGAGAILSFTTGSVELSRALCEATRLFKITVSFGGVASLILMPCFMSHASIPAEVRAARGLPDDLIRISAGIEDIDDLLADLEQAFDAATKAVADSKPALALK
ncbi:METC1 [Auxenochlorella protothecoides x Auxenochlorella symbiontica]